MINRFFFLGFGIFIVIELVLLYINNVNIKQENENYRSISSEKIKKK